MRRASLVLAAFAVVAFAFAVAADQPVQIEEKPLTWKQASSGDAETLYVEICASCHGMDAKGDGPAAPALKDPVPDLTTLARDLGGVYPADEVHQAISGSKRVVAHGTLEMPVWGRAFEDLRPDHNMVRREQFARQRIDELVAYLESLQVQ